MVNEAEQQNQTEVFLLLKDRCEEMLRRVEMLRNQPRCLELLSQESVFGPGIRTLLKIDSEALVEVLNRADEVFRNDLEVMETESHSK